MFEGLPPSHWLGDDRRTDTRPHSPCLAAQTLLAVPVRAVEDMPGHSQGYSMLVGYLVKECSERQEGSWTEDRRKEEDRRKRKEEDRRRSWGHCSLQRVRGDRRLVDWADMMADWLGKRRKVGPRREVCMRERRTVARWKEGNSREDTADVDN